MKLIKKTICLILCLCVTLSILTACKSKAEEDEPLRVLLWYAGFETSSHPLAARIEDLTDSKVQYDDLPAEDQLTKLNAVLAAKEEYDVITMTYDMFCNTVGLGAYMSLNELLDSYGKDILAGTDESLLMNTTVDGDIKGIPFRLSKENYSYGLRIRTDLLAQADIYSIPATPDELYEALKTVKNELGIIPFTHCGAFVDEITSAFGISNVWNVTEKGLENRAEMQGTKDYVIFMNKLYSEGLLDTEWAQNLTADCREKFYSGNALMYQIAWWDEPSATTTLYENFPDASCAYLPPLQNAEGISYMPVSRGPNMVAVIPRSSEKPECAMSWMNKKVSDPELFRKLTIGDEGVHYEIAENGEYKPIQPNFTDEMNFSSVYLTGTITRDYDKYWEQTRLHKDDTLYAEFQKIQENISDAVICYDPLSFMPSNAEYSEISVSVNNYVQDTILQMIVGAKSIDEWDDFVDEYRKMGGQRMNEIVNEWWRTNKDEILPFVMKQ